MSRADATRMKPLIACCPADARRLPAAASPPAESGEPMLAAVEAPLLPSGAPPNILVGVAFVVAWVLCGLLIAVLMRRRGHELGTIVAIGLVFGPLLLAILRRSDDGVPARVISPGSRRAGEVDVVVTVDGSRPETVTTALGVLDLLGDSVRRVTLAAAVEYEAIDDETWDDAKRAASMDLELAAAALGDRHAPELLLLGGPAGRAQLRYAAERHYGVVVVPQGSVRIPRRRGDRVPLIVVAGEPGD